MLRKIKFKFKSNCTVILYKIVCINFNLIIQLDKYCVSNSFFQNILYYPLMLRSVYAVE